MQAFCLQGYDEANKPWLLVEFHGNAGGCLTLVDSTWAEFRAAEEEDEAWASVQTGRELCGYLLPQDEPANTTESATTAPTTTTTTLTTTTTATTSTTSTSTTSSTSTTTSTTLTTEPGLASRVWVCFAGATDGSWPWYGGAANWQVRVCLAAHSAAGIRRAACAPASVAP